jgi:hypothetical protein
MRRALTLWLVVCAVAGAGFAACHHQRPTAFPHRKHVSQIECGGQDQPDCLSCVSCHPGAKNPKLSVAATASTCAGCHRSGEGNVTRYFGEAQPQPSFESSTQFDHLAHMTRPGFERECVFCHGGVTQDQSGPESYPAMAVCLDCHQAEFTEARCVPCHRQDRLAQLVPQSFMRHDAAWPKRHGVASKHGRRLCVQCHSETQCADCHAMGQPLTLAARSPDAVTADRVHRGDFLARHAMEARSTPTRCLRCHTSQSCDGCHVRRGVSGARSSPTNPHPVGWIGSNPRAKSFHGVAARRSLASCAACHDHGPATNCIGCHRVGGHGGSPHRGAGHSSRAVTATLCRYCHVN